MDGTFQRKGFGDILNLFPLAEVVKKLSAVCAYCAEDAYFTQRIVESDQIELIGGEESYKPVCRKCFMKTKNEMKSMLSTPSTWYD